MGFCLSEQNKLDIEKIIKNSVDNPDGCGKINHQKFMTGLQKWFKNNSGISPNDLFNLNAPIIDRDFLYSINDDTFNNYLTEYYSINDFIDLYPNCDNWLHNWAIENGYIIPEKD